MESFGQLINEWEIQSLVLLSFVLQVFLFFTGSLRRCSRNAVLRVTIWVAYLGADVVAIYALGSLSRQKDANMDDNDDDDDNGSLRRNHPLAFLWAPFLLIHLGGQDTITAFSLEDNKLWLRHMLNMLAQVSLALYVFWKSGIWRHSVWLLLVAIFLFIPGIIKYAERTLALMYGNVDNAFVREPSSRSRWWIPSKDAEDDGYEGYICFALRWAPGTKDMFAGRTIGWAGEGNYKKLTHYRLDPNQFFKLFDVEFCIMYSDLYTKTRLLRTTTGVVLRFISLVSTIVALVLFTVSSSSSKAGGYGGTVVADIVITYTLLYGGFLLEVCAAVTTLVASPWTWAWLEAKQHHSLARVSRSLLSYGSFGLQETRPLWSNTMGQYTFLSYLGSTLLLYVTMPFCWQTWNICSHNIDLKMLKLCLPHILRPAAPHLTWIGQQNVLLALFVLPHAHNNANIMFISRKWVIVFISIIIKTLAKLITTRIVIQSEMKF